VEVLTQRPTDKRFEEAAFFIRDDAINHPTLLAEHAETLLGTAALIASDLDNPHSPLVDPRPEALRSLDTGTHRIHLDTALNGIAQAIGWAAQIHSHTVGSYVIQTLERLGDGYDRLKAALVRCLGIMSQSREGLAVALPAFSAAMMDRSQRVRAEAARAYGDLAKNASEDLPSLVHESFLVLLHDPYVIVHKAALKALGRARLPPKFQSAAFDCVAGLVATYTANRSDDEFLSECLERLMALCKQIDALSPQILQAIVATLDGMEPYVAARFIKYCGWRLRTAPGYFDLRKAIGRSRLG
jgi:hypothetical protein